MTINEIFHHVYEHPDTMEVPYQARWENGTGYLNHAVNDESITAVSRCTDSWGRKILLLPQESGKNIVIFQRFGNRNSIYVSNHPSDMDEELAFLLLEHESAKREQHIQPISNQMLADNTFLLHFQGLAPSCTPSC
jgi:glycogen debranching enzyme